MLRRIAAQSMKCHVFRFPDTDQPCRQPDITEIERRCLYEAFIEITIVRSKQVNDITGLQHRNPGYCIVGGGHSIAAIDQLGLESKFSHVSMGGGASITYLSGEPLPGIEALKKAALRMRKS